MQRKTERDREREGTGRVKGGRERKRVIERDRLGQAADVSAEG